MVERPVASLINRKYHPLSISLVCASQIAEENEDYIAIFLIFLRLLPTKFYIEDDFFNR